MAMSHFASIASLASSSVALISWNLDFIRVLNLGEILNGLLCCLCLMVIFVSKHV